MDKNLFQSRAFRQPQKGIQMCIMAVYAAIGKQAAEMQCGIIFPTMLHSRQKLRVFIEIPVLNGFRDAGQFLINNTARADIQVADLGIAHLALRQADSAAAGVAFYAGVFFQYPVQHRGICLFNGVAVCFIIDAEAVQYHQNCRFLFHFWPP